MVSSFYKCIFSFILICFSFPTISAETKLNVNRSVIFDNQSHPPKLIFSDGREATLAVFYQKPLSAKLKSKLIESTCEDSFVGTECDTLLSLFNYKYAFIWTKHSDSTKIGKILKYKYNSNTNESLSDLESYSASFTTDIESLPQELQSKMKNPIMSCNQQNWIDYLPNINGQPTVNSWTSEQMNPNAYTGISENTSLFQAQNVKIVINKKQDTKEYKYKFEFAKNLDTLAIVSPQQTAYFVKNDRLCTIQFQTEIKVLEQNPDQNWIYVKPPYPMAYNSSNGFFSPLQSLRSTLQYIIPNYGQNSGIEVQ